MELIRAIQNIDVSLQNSEDRQSSEFLRKRLPKVDSKFDEMVKEAMTDVLRK